MFVRRYFLFACCVIGVFCLALAAPDRALAENALPADLQEFAGRVQAILQSGKTASDDPTAIPLKRLSWRGPPSEWNFALLPLPVRSGEPTQYLAVFSRFHGVESDSDLVFALHKGQAGWQFEREIPETQTNGYRVRAHQFTIRLDLVHSGASLTDMFTLECTTPEVGPCLLRLSCDLKVDSLTCDGHPVPLGQAPGLLAVLPPAGRRCTLQLAYHRAPTPSSEDTIRPDGVMLLSYWWPHIARLPASHRLTVTVPTGWTADSQGELQQREETAEGIRFSFRNDLPTCYFALVAAPYTITSRQAGGLRLSVYQVHPDKTKADQALDTLERALDFFSIRFGRFPYTHYELVETPGSGSSALEEYSFALFSGGDFGPLVHELSHTWWGGIVPNPYTTTLWNESLAEYSYSLFLRAMSATAVDTASHGLHAAPDFGRGLIARYPVPISEAWDIFYHLGHSTAGYVKGPAVLAMLEDLLGPDTMLRCLRRFCRAHPRGEPGDWAEFARAVDQVTGRRYEWFFTQWLSRPGVPVLGLADMTQRREGDHFVVTGRILQEGTPYRLRLPLAVELDDGTTVRRYLIVDGASTPLRLMCPRAPRWLRVDPEGSVLMAGPVGAAATDPFAHHFAE